MDEDVKYLFSQLFTQDTDGEILVKRDGGWEPMEPQHELMVQRLLKKHKVEVEIKAIKPEVRKK